MEDDGTLICRLCFKTGKGDFEVIKGATKESLNFLQLSLDLDISDEPVVCSSCADNLKKCVTFKTDCLHKRGHVWIKQEDVQMDVQNVLVRENVVDTLEKVDINETKESCCCCMEPVTCKTTVLLVNAEMNVTVMLARHFPELVLNGTTDSMCTVCYKFLQNQLAFVSTCLSVEGRIKEYCKVEGTDSKGQVDLSKVLHFTSKRQLQDSIHGNFNAIKIEKDCEGIETEDKVKVKNEDRLEIEEPGFYYVKKEDIELKMEEDYGDRFDAYPVPHKNENDLELHQLPEEFTTEVTAFKCKMCTYETSREGDLSCHTLTHKQPAETAVHKCELCTFQTKHKNSLQRHISNHKASSEATMYKCEICTFQTKHKYNLKQHGLVHKSASEITMYKCEQCTFQTKHKRHLEPHILVHKSESEITLHKCELCTYQNRCKRNLTRHMLIHKSTSEVTMYKCEICAFESRYKYCLLNHMVMHKNPAEVPVYKCEVCSFQVKHKKRLQLHMLTHESTSEVAMYKCDLCKYQSPSKNYLARHLVTHRDSSEVIMYKCEVCAYQSKYKRNLSEHMLTHKNRSEIIMYKCEVCDHQSKRKRGISKHMLIHKNGS